MKSKAQQLYEEHANNHPTIHSNRFAMWTELTEEQKNVWRRAASAKLEEEKKQ